MPATRSTSPATASATARIDAPPDRLYGIIADYREGHPRILPRPPFVSLDVEEGGYGEGTVISVRMRVLGSEQTFRAWITEPEPGRTLVETSDTGYVTTFTVEADDDRASRVTIHSELTPRRGLLATVERWIAPRMLRPVFVRELALLDRVARERHGGDPPPR